MEAKFDIVDNEVRFSLTDMTTEDFCTVINGWRDSHRLYESAHLAGREQVAGRTGKDIDEYLRLLVEQREAMSAVLSDGNLAQYQLEPSQ